MADLFLMSQELQCNLHKILHKTVILWKWKVVMCRGGISSPSDSVYRHKYSFIILQHVLDIKYEAA